MLLLDTVTTTVLDTTTYCADCGVVPVMTPGCTYCLRCAEDIARELADICNQWADEQAMHEVWQDIMAGEALY